MTRAKAKILPKESIKWSQNKSHKARIFDEMSLMSSKMFKMILYKNIIYITTPHPIMPYILTCMCMLYPSILWA